MKVLLWSFRSYQDQCCGIIQVGSCQCQLGLAPPNCQIIGFSAIQFTTVNCTNNSFKGLDDGAESYSVPKAIWEAIGDETAATGLSIPSTYGS
jgi:hypothetical protein